MPFNDPVPDHTEMKRRKQINMHAAASGKENNDAKISNVR